MNQAALSQFEIQRMFSSIDSIIELKEKNEKTKDALIAVTEVTMDLIAKTIRYIETPTLTVDNPEFVLEFLRNCDKNVYLSIRDYNTSLKAKTELKPLDVKCISCEHDYQQPFTINASDFFG